MRAATLTVTSLADDGTSGTLRSLIAAAAPFDTITFQPGLSGTIALASAPLTLTRDVTIIGPGASVISVVGHPFGIMRFRALTVNVGVTATVSGLTFRGGLLSGSGGTVADAGTLTLTDCVATDSSAGSGGGIVNDGTLALIGVTVGNNQAGDSGCCGGMGTGGGLAHNSGTATVSLGSVAA